MPKIKTGKKHAFTFYADYEEITKIITETRKKRFEKDEYFFKSDSSVLEYLVRGGK